MLKKSTLVCALLAVAAVPAWAGNGHLLHGIGPVNSSMGGAGVGLPTDAITALYTNPALLTQLDGWQVGFGLEFFADDPRITSRIGNATGTNDADGDLGLLPAIATSYHKPGSRWGYGFGLLAVAGFRTDWPGNVNDPIFQPQPGGYGRTQSDLTITKIPVAIAYQATPKLSLGFALNVYRGTFAVAPFPIAPADCSYNDRPTPQTPDPNIDPAASNVDCYFPPAAQQQDAWAFTPQVGLYFQATPKFSIGFNYTAEQDFSGYEWNSLHINPDLTNFGQEYLFAEDVDGPPATTLGIGVRPSSKLALAFDVKFVEYLTTNGFKGQGFDRQRRILRGVGWDDIYIYMAGLQYQATPRLKVRAGLNFNESPIVSERIFQSLGTPSTYEEHYTVGLGIDVGNKLTLNVSGYYVPRNEKTGPINSFSGIVPDSSFTISDPISAVLVGFEWNFED